MGFGHILKGIMVGWFFTGLIAFVLFIIPGIDFLGQILGGTIQNIEALFTVIPGLPAFFATLGVLLITVLELFLFNVYPLSWILTWRPWDALTILYMIVPWICAGLITGKLVVKSPKDALGIGIGLIISNSLWCVLWFIVLPNVLMGVFGGGMMGGLSPLIQGIIEGAAAGLTDMPPGLSAILTQVQGGGLFTGAAIMIGMTKEPVE